MRDGPKHQTSREMLAGDGRGLNPSRLVHAVVRGSVSWSREGAIKGDGIQLYSRPIVKETLAAESRPTGVPG